MYCTICGSRIRENSKYCSKCGAVVEQQDIPPITGEPATMFLPRQESARSQVSVPNTSGSSGVLLKLEGALSAVLGLMVPLVPSLRIDLWVTSSEVSPMNILFRLRDITGLLDDYGWIAVLLVVMAFASAALCILNAVKCLFFGGSQSLDRWSSPWSAAGYALFMLLATNMLAGKTYGVGGGSSWLWVLFVGGVACGLLSLVRRTSSSKRSE